MKSERLMTFKGLVAGLLLLAALLLFAGCFGGGSTSISNTNGGNPGTGEQPMMVPQVALPGPYVPDEILVGFNAGVTPAQIQQILQAQGVAVKNWNGEQYLDSLGMRLVKIPPNTVPAEVSSFQQLAQVAFAEPNLYNFMVVSPVSPPDDIYFPKQWALQNTGQNIFGAGTPGADISAVPAWLLETGSGTVDIGVVDCGVSSDHPDLSSKILATGDFTGSVSGAQDICGHGTHVAGIAAGIGNNVLGIAGVCWGCSILNSKALGDNGSGTSAALAAAINAVNAWPDTHIIISISIGYPVGTACPGSVQTAITNAWGNNRLIVVAAGNNNSSVTTALRNCANTFRVAATDNTDARAGFSDFGNEVDIAAPGVNNYSTLPPHPNNMGPEWYGYLSGTSMATPTVSGAAGLVWSHFPGLTNQQLRDRLCLRADNIPGTRRTNNGPNYWYCGRLNVFNALQ